MDNYNGIEEGYRHPEHVVTMSEDELVDRRPAKPEKFREFCRAYIDEIGAPLMRPFIDDDPDSNGHLPVPTGYEEKRAEVEQRLRDIFIVQVETTATESEGGSIGDTHSETAIEKLEEWEPTKE